MPGTWVAEWMKQQVAQWTFRFDALAKTDKDRLMGAVKSIELQVRHNPSSACGPAACAAT